jgi:two-component system response regulator FixJ
MMTAHGDIPLAVRAVTMGAFEFIEKPFTAARLKVVLDRGRDLLAGILARAAQVQETDGSLAVLSERQRQVLEGVVEGLTSKEIAIRLGLSPRTVEGYRMDIMKKLNVRTTAELCRVALLTSDQSSGQRGG